MSASDGMCPHNNPISYCPSCAASHQMGNRARMNQRAHMGNQYVYNGHNQMGDAASDLAAALSSAGSSAAAAVDTSLVNSVSAVPAVASALNASSMSALMSNPYVWIGGIALIGLVAYFMMKE